MPRKQIQTAAETRFVDGFDSLLQGLSQNGGAWSTALRQEALSHYVEAGLPTSRDEAWRFTSPGRLGEFERGVADAPGEVDAKTRKVAEINGFDALVVEIVDGTFVSGETTEGMTIRSWYEAGAVEGVREALARDCASDAPALNALNAAWCRDGLYLHVARNTRVPEPVHVRCISTRHDQPTRVHPRLHIELEEGAELEIVFDHVSAEGSSDLVNLVTDVRLAANSRLEAVKVVRTDVAHLHTDVWTSEQARDSRFRLHTLSLGGQLVRNEVQAHLRGENAECTLNGLTVADGDQLVDNHTWIHHEVPHTRSAEHYRAILDDRARGVFSGRVFIAVGAKGTDAQQHNASLVLSDTAQMNALPQLEIYNDDVKASHGATLGQLDEDGLFYLRSRGIPEEEARNLLTYAFANVVVDSVPWSGVRNIARRRILEHLPYENLGEELV